MVLNRSKRREQRILRKGVVAHSVKNLRTQANFETLVARKTQRGSGSQPKSNRENERRFLPKTFFIILLPHHFARNSRPSLLQNNGDQNDRISSKQTSRSPTPPLQSTFASSNTNDKKVSRKAAKTQRRASTATSLRLGGFARDSFLPNHKVRKRLPVLV